MKLPEIIGIAGTNGSGKDTLADLRFDRLGVEKVSLSDILRSEATKRGLDHGRENLSAISTAWGREFGAGALSLMTIRNYWDTRTDETTGLSIVSVRRPDEASAIQQEGGTVIWVDAEREERYARIRAGMRGRIDDLVSFEEFGEQEDREMYPGSDDPFVLNMAGVRDIADVHLTNDFDSEDAYKAFLSREFNL